MSQIRRRQDKLPRQDPAERLDWWKAELGHYLLADLTPALIVEQRDKLLADAGAAGRQRTPATVNRYLAALSHAFTIAVKEWGWIEDSPFRKLSKLREPRGRVRFLSDDERKRLLAACRESSDPDLYPAVVLALSTGARRMEALSIRPARASPPSSAEAGRER